MMIKLGPLVSGFLVKSGVISISILLWILAVISFMSCVLMTFIKYLELDKGFI